MIKRFLYWLRGIPKAIRYEGDNILYYPYRSARIVSNHRVKLPESNNAIFNAVIPKKCFDVFPCLRNDNHFVFVRNGIAYYFHDNVVFIGKPSDIKFCK